MGGDKVTLTALANFLHAFAIVLLYLLIVAIFARAAGSWFVRDSTNALMRFLVDVTEPILAPLRRLIPMATGVDFSPMIAILVLYLLSSVLTRTP